MLSNLLVRVLVNNDYLPITELKLKVEPLNLADGVNAREVKVDTPNYFSNAIRSTPGQLAVGGSVTFG